MTTFKQYARFLRPALAVTAVALSAVAVSSTPASAVSRSSIVSKATSELNNSSRNHESPAGSDCNYYTGIFRTWKEASGCPSTDGVQWRKSDWCADFVKYVWSKSGVTYADLPEDPDMPWRLSGWASSFRDYGQKYGTWHTRSSGYTPQPGDAVVFDWDDASDDIDHVGIVTSATSSTVYTIEGNTGDRTQAKSYSRSSSYIVGYSAPVGATRASSYGADFDGNGVGDIFATADGKLHVWNGKGSNNFATRVEVGPGWAPFSRPIAGDFNGDGKSDLAAVKDGSTLHIWNGKGDNSFGNAVELGAGWGPYAGTLTSVGDVNRDGRDDIAAVSNGTLYVWNGNGSNGFGNAVAIGPGWSSFSKPVGGDFDGDGIGDLAAVKDGSTLHIWNGKGANNFSDAIPIGAGWAPYAGSLMSLGDVNRDGHGDIAAVNNGTLYLWNGNGSNGFGNAIPIGPGWAPYV